MKNLYYILVAILFFQISWATQFTKRLEIVKNDGNQLTLLIGEIIEGKSQYYMKYKLPSGRTSKAQAVQKGKFYIFNILELGPITVEFYLGNPDLFEKGTILNWAKEKYDAVMNLPVWSQDIFVVPNSSLNMSDEVKQKIAQKYSPIAALDSTEDYLPSSLEYIFNQELVSEELAKEQLSLKFAHYDGTKFTDVPSKMRKRFAERPEIFFSYNEAVDILASNGDSIAVLNTKHVTDSSMATLRRFGNPDNVVIYYSFLPNNKQNEILLNYHFLYSFDPKLGSVDDAQAASHMYDRESVTVVLDRTSLEPKHVIYGAHLDNQTMGHLSDDESTLQQWKGGKVVVKWSDVIKVKNHPFVAIAKGSHAPYPAPGLYAVYLRTRVKTLIEPANSAIGLLPSDLIDTKQSFEKSYRYNLKNLELDRITSRSWNRVLSFSGYMVDVLSHVNAKFPPYTSREAHSDKWSDVSTAYVWSQNKVSLSSQNAIKNILQIQPAK